MATDLTRYEVSAPTLLAQQPVRLDQREVPDKDWDTEFSYFESDYGAKRNWRYSTWMHWAEIAQFSHPQRYRWLVVANLYRRGSPVNQAIIDTSVISIRKICGSGMVDGIYPSTRPWFKHAPGIPGYEPDRQGQLWLSDLDEAIYTVLAQSNFYDRKAQQMQDLTDFGTSPFIIYEDAEEVIRCYVPCAGEYYAALGAGLRVDDLTSEYTMTVKEIVAESGLANCPEQIRTLWEAGGASHHHEFVVCCTIQPNFPIAGPGNRTIPVVKGSQPFREVKWLRGIKTARPLSRRGFWEQPFTVARWSTHGNNPYAEECPGIDSLGDYKQLQQETKRKLEAIEKLVRPPMGADPELKNEPSSTLPGHITYVNSASGKKGMWPLYEVKPDLAAMLEDLKEVKENIAKNHLVDVWMAISQMEGVQPRNAIEIAERKGEKLQRLGPVVGMIKTEDAEYSLQRIAKIIERRRLLRPMPASLRGVPLKLHFMDMVTLAQLGAETANMESTLAFAGNLGALAMQSGQAPPLRIFDLDESMRLVAERKSYPVRGLFTEDEVKTHDQVKAQQAQAQQAVQAGQAAVQAAGELGKIDVGPGATNAAAMLGSRLGFTGGP